MIVALLLQGEAVSGLTLSEMLFQAGVVAVFVVYSIIESKANAKERADQAAANADERQKLSTDHADSMKEQTDLMISFMDRERTQRREIMETALGALASNITSLTEGIAGLTKAMALHDEAAIRRHEKLGEAVAKVEKALFSGK